MQPNIATSLAGIETNSDSKVLQIAAPDNSSHRNFGLDLARAVAISLVVASHFNHKYLDSLGFWGVELFFALSGFLIGQILWRNFSNASNWTSSRITNFWKRRWWRTMPNYYLFFVILLVSAFLNHEEIPSLSSLSKFIWFGQFLTNHNWGFYSVSWSLCIEEWFYLAFPLLLFCSKRVINDRKTAFILSLIIIIISSIIIRYTLANQNATHYLRGITLARLDAIAYGVLVAFFTLTIDITAKQKYLALGAGIVFQILSVLYTYFFGVTHIATNQLFLILVPLGFAIMIPSISLLTAPTKEHLIFTRIINRISLWSYSIYLSHGPIMWLMYYLLKNYRTTFYGNFFSKIIGLVITLIASFILYQFFEVPFTKMRPKELK